MSQFKLCKPTIARIAPFFLAFSFLSTVPPLPTPYFLLPASAQTADARKAEANRLLQQGLQQTQTSDYEAAIQSYEKALTIYRALQNRLGEANALNNLGLGSVFLPQYESLIGEANALNNLGQSYYSVSQYNKAIGFHQQSLAIYRAIQNRLGEANALNNLGLNYIAVSQYDKAIELNQQALTIYRAIQNRHGEANALSNLGRSYYSVSQYNKAIEFHQQALAIHRAIRNRSGEANALSNLGQSYHSVSQYNKAIEFHQQALAIHRAIQSRHGEANSLSNLGSAYTALSQYNKAVEFHQQALVIFRAIRNRGGEAAALSSLGTAYRSLSQPDKAIELQQQALMIVRQIGSRRSEAAISSGLGSTYLTLSQYSQAIKHYEQALAIFRAVGDRNGEAGALLGLGSAYLSLAQYSKATEYYRQALTIYLAVGNRIGEASAQSSLGAASASLSQHSQAIEKYQQALTISRAVGDRSGEANTLVSLGNAYRSLSQFDKAIENHQQALTIARQIGNRNSEARTLSALGAAYHLLPQYDKAIAYHRQALLILQAVGDRAGEGAALTNLGLTLLKTGDARGAEKTLWAAIKLWESLRPGLTDENKVSLFETQAITYRTLQQALIAQNNPTAALEVAERGRTRAFVELLEKQIQERDVSLPLNSEATVTTIDQIKRIAKTHKASLVEYSIIYDSFKIQGKRATRESELYIWVIQPTGEISFRQVDLKPLWQQHNTSLSRLVIGNQESLAVRGRNTLGVNPQPNLPTLYQLLIDPIAPLLPKDPNAHVIFIPQGPLFQVPFPALQTADGNYLIQKHAILTAPSIQVLALTQQQRQKLASQVPLGSGKALVLGNPTMPQMSLSLGAAEQALPPLPGAEAEAKTIAALLNTQAIIGAQGTKAEITRKMPQASIIHLATHGLLDNIRGLGSAIALAPSGTDNGWLTAEEILEMKLQASLVVLSACNTAEGRITGDGVIGLSRSLISAGVPSVIVSLWAVPDAPTAELMQAFYQNLQRNPDKAQALRQAMLTMMKTHPQPRDWAAFTLIGEAE
ncbi:tetratricopeptide repeat protein [Leptolyngbya sp. FACHB-36]|uniref:CHAT domain-containing tetratricopeptide repeat protein n=1 Tax=Leptolyngbya sp. FACHB-36 TaxID=2692808 RepID=UPI001680E619|nr:tetratricopeptide repeat protein [Leptolyngbya sp. FACHB-36]MBD2019124.1 tetratricopeptide repeat protein [Leptolyngbya sp. FACHB-36]